jgi:hypothetical protein
MRLQDRAKKLGLLKLFQSKETINSHYLSSNFNHFQKSGRNYCPGPAKISNGPFKPCCAEAAAGPSQRVAKNDSVLQDQGIWCSVGMYRALFAGVELSRGTCAPVDANNHRNQKSQTAEYSACAT